MRRNAYILYTVRIEETADNYGGCYADVFPIATGMNLNIADGLKSIIGYRRETVMSAYIMPSKKEAEEKASGLNKLYASKGNYYYDNYKV